MQRVDRRAWIIQSRLKGIVRLPSACFQALLLVSPNINLAAAVHPRIASVIGAAIDRGAAATVPDAAGEVCTARIDGWRIGSHVKVGRSRAQVVEQGVSDCRVRVFAPTRLIQGISLVVRLA